MQRVLSTYVFVHRRLNAGLLGEIARAGIPAVELFCSRPHFDYRSAQQVRELASWLSGNNLALHSIHAPPEREFGPGRESGAPLSISDPERVRRLDAVDEVRHALELAESIPFRFLVMHLGSSRQALDAPTRDAAFTSLESLMIFAKQRGVTIALENTPGELATPANLRQFVHETRLDLRLCFDLGHAHMEGGVEASLETMRELIVTTHVHDNRGEKDEHLLPYQGAIDWNAVLKVLPAELPVVLELKDPAAPAGAPESSAADLLGAVRSVFEKLEQAVSANDRPPG